MSTDPALLVDGVDLAADPSRKLINADDLFAVPTKRGSNVTVPYADGEIRTDKKTAARTISVTYLLAAADYGHLQKTYSDILALVPDAASGDDMGCTLTLRVAYPAPTGTVDKTADAEFISALYQQDPNSDRHARVTLQFRLLTGVFS